MDIGQARIHAQEALGRADQATSGPWDEYATFKLNSDGLPNGAMRRNALPDVIDTWWDSMADEGGMEIDEKDVVFIAYSRSDVPLLANNILEALEEVERLTDCLKRANHQAEHFEREWYLRGDEIERLEAMNMELSAKLAEVNRGKRDEQ